MESSNRINSPEGRLGLGLGIDMPWGSSVGFNRNEDDEGSLVTARTRRFFRKHQSVFAYAFLAFQPKGRSKLCAKDYFSAYDEFYSFFPSHKRKVFHHTLLNLGTVDRYDRSEIYKFTNTLADRYDFAWVVEDLGLWSVKGKTVPFPLPPFMTKSGLSFCIANIREATEQLSVPLYVEFPGFTEGTNFHIGKVEAFNYFAELAYECDVPVTIDIGHILSYQWLLGKKGSDMFSGLERLPLSQCREMHLSGCEIVDGKFRDLHHGVLMDEQIDLLEYLLPMCPNLTAVTYEDPRFDEQGDMISRARYNFERLARIVSKWAEEKEPSRSLSKEVARGRSIEIDLGPEPDAVELSTALYTIAFKPNMRNRFIDGQGFEMFPSIVAENLETIDLEELTKTGRRLRRDLLGGNFEGSGGLRRSFPGVFAALSASEISEIDMMDAFFESKEFDDYTEVPFHRIGICLEEAFFTFLCNFDPFLKADDMNRLLASHEFLYAIHSVLAVTEEPAFRIDTPLVKRTASASFGVLYLPTGIVYGLVPHHIDVSSKTQPFLYAANSRRRFVFGAITEQIHKTLESYSSDSANEVSKRITNGCPTTEKLYSLGLI